MLKSSGRITTILVNSRLENHYDTVYDLIDLYFVPCVKISILIYIKDIADRGITYSLQFN